MSPAVMTIAQCMTREVSVADPDNCLQSAAQIMANIDAGFLPIMARGELIGVVTDRDIAIRGVAAGLPPETGICEVMSTDVQYCFEDDDIDDVLGNLGDIQVRRLPVLDRQLRLVGIVSITDLASSGNATGAGEALKDIARPSGLHSQAL